MSTVRQIGEDGLIEIFASDQLPPDAQVLVANGDDAAAWSSRPGEANVLTTDTLVENVHFTLEFSTPHQVGRKLVAVNVSDCAGMGADPAYAFLSVCFAPETEVDIVRGIAAGIREHAKEHGLILLGGNTTSTLGPAILGMTVVARQSVGRLISRGGSRPGDVVLVTGTLGDARGGLKFLYERPADPSPEQSALISAQNDPVPRVSAGLALAATGVVRAMADVSDGLGRDLRRLLEPAALGARVRADQVPISAALSAEAESPLEHALVGGEDYELLLTAAAGDVEQLRDACAVTGVPLTPIGEVTDNPGFIVEDGAGSRELPGGFEHFD